MGKGRAAEVDEDADWNETEDLDDGGEPLPPACSRSPVEVLRVGGTIEMSAPATPDRSR
jgi:hypothetical protein